MTKLKYERILLKLSGEALGSFEPELVDFIVSEIKEARELGAKIAVVVGGGNIYRGINAEKDGIREETGHWMGMLAITINAFALTDLFNSKGLPTISLSALGKIGDMAEYSIEAGKKILSENKVLLLSGGTGTPFVTSDTAAAQRAKELGLQAVFKATKVDGVYDCDPVSNQNAQKFDQLSFDETLERNLKVMDREAFEICQKNSIPVLVFKMEKGNIKRAMMGEKVGTTIE